MRTQLTIKKEELQEILEAFEAPGGYTAEWFTGLYNSEGTEVADEDDNTLGTYLYAKLSAGLEDPKDIKDAASYLRNTENGTELHLGVDLKEVLKECDFGEQYILEVTPVQEIEL